MTTKTPLHKQALYITKKSLAKDRLTLKIMRRLMKGDIGYLSLKYLYDFITRFDNQDKYNDD